jgi:hypothetical protein
MILAELGESPQAENRGGATADRAAAPPRKRTPKKAEPAS